MATPAMETIQARSEGIKASWQRRRKYIHTDATDAVIRHAYQQWITYGNRTAIKSASVKLGWPRFAVTSRAMELRLTRTKSKPWTDAEEQMLERWGWLSLPRIAIKLRACGFRRTEAAIHIKLTRLKVRSGIGGWTARSLADLLGIDDHKVSIWIRNGWLTAQRTGIRAFRNDKFFIERNDLRRFVLNHPEEIVLAKIDPAMTLAFLDVISGGKLCEEYRKEAA
jgi:hypothetical protein